MGDVAEINGSTATGFVACVLCVNATLVERTQSLGDISFKFAARTQIAHLVRSHTAGIHTLVRVYHRYKLYWVGSGVFTPALR